MTEKESPELRHDGASGLVYRLRPAVDPNQPALLLFHGLTGDEEVMWIIDSALPGGGLVAAPRGFFEAPDGGYSWLEAPTGPGFDFEALAPAIEVVQRWIEALRTEHDLAQERMVYLGFSQGAALAFTLAREPDLRPGALVCLSGFVPQGSCAPLAGLPVFWGHGTRDDTLPIERARSDEARLADAGAQVHFCEADVGHKVGVECMRGLRAWLEEHFPPAT